MNTYLAKSNPQETIQEHTENLIRNFNIIRSIYPNLEINWDILYHACLLHDLGKMNKRFQYKIKTGKKVEGEIPHGILSLAFVNTKVLKAQGFTKDEIRILAHSIAYHHERDLSYSNTDLEEAIELLKEEANCFSYEKLPKLEVKKLSARYFAKNRVYEQDDEKVFYNYVLIKGLLNRIDYAASAYIDIEVKNDFLMNSLKCLMDRWQKECLDTDWNELQRYMLKNRDENVIAIAETGMGKTEAGLLWIGDNKGFFTLPLKTAINAMYDRISTNIVRGEFIDRVGLLHSDTHSEYLNRGLEDVELDKYFNKTKQLSLPITVCTLDQIFDFVYRYRGFESKLATLSYSKVVIDEVQMYSSDLLAYLIIGLSYITKVGGKFAILTATLPNIVEDLLKEEEIQFIPSKTFTNNKRLRHSVKINRKLLDVENIIELYDKNKVLVICNTVKEAQRIYKELDQYYGAKNLNLFHSNFIKKDRKEKEKRILSIGDKESQEYGIWVTTQVVEASLDIDFDILITELSDLNSLFQRMGRCYRNRSFNEQGYNCYVFDGGEKDCSGVGYVIDKEIFALSKKALRNVEGPLNEEEKMKLVSDIYTTENLKDTEYYKLIKTNINYVKSIEDYEKDKFEIKRIFRNIHTQTIIPIKIYYEYLGDIENYIQILAKNYDKSLSIKEREKLKIQKSIARTGLLEFTVSVPYYRVNKNVIIELMINRYEFIPVLDCEYSKEIGIEYLKKDIKNKNAQYDNFF